MSRKVSKVFKQSGVIPYRVNNGKVEILLITTRNFQHWVIPKGDIPNGMSPPASAAKEAWEEAGVIGQVDTNELGTYKYRKGGKSYRVKMYLLPVEMLSEDYPEASKRKRQWVEVTTAIRWVKFSSLKRILKGFFQVKSHFCAFQDTSNI
ncbi:NUDIX hydrolase [Nostoc sp. UCD121]|uniref:NUDIX hydrolase n=1 Tax=unclassified Nostoc TaxID=2593658 RepID=UPI0016232E35|nr:MULTISPECIES: NUDIX hydrolase [unclassified Nostoc]MBC1224592.1 NUDIX hydrolase [Nostoc sp. UCD120]MBC1274490.1 NUDIX hydrolase [Nostoc sp. UCD121]MBC1299192.1 NUDIX hydrolase [Nostoc sp. UCD122]